MFLGVVVGAGAGAPVVGSVELTDPEVEVDTSGGDVVVSEVGVEAPAVVELVVMVDVLVTVVVADGLVVVAGFAAHELVSVATLRSIDPAATPS